MFSFEEYIDSIEILALLKNLMKIIFKKYWRKYRITVVENKKID